MSKKCNIMLLNTGTCALIGTIAYGAQHGMEAKSLNFSFAFCIIAAAGSYLSGFLIMLLNT
jgi:hypothetical protein